MADVDKIALCTQARRKRCGMAAVAAPKNVQGERERKKEEKGGKKENRGESVKTISIIAGPYVNSIQFVRKGAVI